MAAKNWKNTISSPWKVLNVPSQEEFLKKVALKEHFEFSLKKGGVKKSISVQVVNIRPASKNNQEEEGVWLVEGFYFVGHIDTKAGKGCLIINNSFMDLLDS